VLPSKVSDACLPSLAKLKKLEKLHLGAPADYPDKSEKQLTLSAVIDLFENSFQRTKRDALKAVGIPHHVTADGEIFDIGLEVAFIHPSITNAIIDHCNECPRLERIRFHGTEVDDAGITRLNPMSRVHTIDLRGTKCSTKGLAHIASMRDMRSVTLPFTATNEGIHQICQNKKLTSLIAVCPDATEEALPSIGTLADLTSLRIDGMKVTREGVVHLEQLSNLTELQFNNSNIPQECFASVGKLVKLKTLGLDNSTITDEGLKYLANLKQLEVLSTLDTSVTSVGRLHLFRNLQQRSKLETIALEGGDITRNKQGQIIRVFFNGHHDESLIIDEHLELVAELTDLTELVLYRQNISGDGFRHLAKLQNLNELNLYHSEKISDASIKHLAALPAIERISLYGCESITDKALPLLKDCKTLNSLSLRRTQTTKEGVATLQKLLPSCEISGNR